MKRQTPVTTVEQRRAQWLKGVLDLCVLAQLDQGEAYGYELAKGLEMSGLGEIKGGTLYPLLNRLEREGLVTTTWRANLRGPDRKYYRITPAGHSTLAQAGPAWFGFADTVLGMLGAGSGDAQ